MKAYIGFDPGVKGAMALLLQDGGYSYKDWAGEQAMFDMLVTWGQLYDIQAVAIEKQHGIRGNSAKSNTTFQQHVGACNCLIKLAGFEPVQVTPQQWMKRRVPAKKGPTDKPSLLYVSEKYPALNLRGLKGGWKDGRSDAICIAEWCREYCNKGGV